MNRKVRYFYVFKGRVQGVGFRWTVMNYAMKHKLTGWISNLDNGDVEMQIQGDEVAIDMMIQEVRKTSRMLTIYDYAQKEIPLVEGEERFRVR